MPTHAAATLRAPPVIAFALTALLYFAAGLAGFALTIVPGGAPPLFPAAGVALAAVLIGGRRLLPAVLLGAFVLHVLPLGADAAAAFSPSWTSLLLAAGISLGATLQTAAAAALLQRFVGQPLTIADARELLCFVACAAVACLISSGIGNAALWAAGQPPAVGLWLNVPAWWIGDLVGMLIFVPIGMTFFGSPREAWAPRRPSVGVALSLITLVLASGIQAVGRWHEERRLADFERDATSAVLLLSAQLQEPLQALKALHGVLLASGPDTESAIPAAMREWLVPSHLTALGWAKWLRRDEVPAFVAQVQAAGSPNYRVFDLPGSSVDPAADVAAVRFIEPMRGDNPPVIGLNSLSAPASRQAILASRHTGRAAATAGIGVSRPEGPVAGTIGVVVFQVVASPSSTATGTFDPLPRGVGFATVQPEQQLLALRGNVPAYLRLCIVDRTPGAPTARLAGPSGCEDADRSGPVFSRPLDFAGRRWELRVLARAEDLPGGRDLDVWLFALVGLLATAMLGGFLLVITSRTRRIEIAVNERTAALRAEVQERELAETALRESEQRFRNILNNVPMGICYTDLRGNVKQTNPRFSDMVRYSEEELLRLNNADFTHPDDREQDYQLSVQLINGDIPMYRRQKRYVTGSGTVVRVQTTVTLLRDAGGTPRRLVGCVEDVSEHMRLEDAERAREAAEASNRAKSEFLSRMSHELRTPLNAMLGFAQLLELDPRQPLAATQRTWVAQIQQAGWHLLEMINDVLDLSRIESGNLRLQTETLNLDELIDSVRAMVQGDAEQRRIVIAQDRPSGALSALGDATRVKQILTNLLSNAVKYNAEAGRVHIVSRRISEHAVEISVSDSGLGMTPEQLAQLFQPFNRLGREKSNLEGTGIGLVISQRLAELMGGTLRASSVAGAGSTFSLTLPCEPEPSTIPSDFDAAPEEPAEYHRRVVHYVEDNETNVEVMRGILAQRPQVELEVSITGLDGLAAIRARRPDLILLDMHLPDISGMELLRHLKADPRLAPIPVVVVSADAVTQQVEAAYEAGCANYLTKPVNIASLLHLVDTLLEEMDTRYG